MNYYCSVVRPTLEAFDPWQQPMRQVANLSTYDIACAHEVDEQIVDDFVDIVGVPPTRKDEAVAIQKRVITRHGARLMSELQMVEADESVMLDYRELGAGELAEVIDTYAMSFNRLLGMYASVHVSEKGNQLSEVRRSLYGKYPEQFKRLWKEVKPLEDELTPFEFMRIYQRNLDGRSAVLSFLDCLQLGRSLGLSTADTREIAARRGRQDFEGLCKDFIQQRDVLVRSGVPQELAKDVIMRSSSGSVVQTAGLYALAFGLARSSSDAVPDVEDMHDRPLDRYAIARIHKMANLTEGVLAITGLAEEIVRTYATPKRKTPKTQSDGYQINFRREVFDAALDELVSD